MGSGGCVDIGGGGDGGRIRGGGGPVKIIYKKALLCPVSETKL